MQIGNIFSTQSAQSAQVTFSGNTGSAQALSNVGSGLVGNSKPMAGSGAAARNSDVKAAGSVSNLLGNKETSKSGVMSREKFAEIRTEADERAPFNMTDPQGCAGYSIDRDGSYSSMVKYSTDWTNRAARYSLGGDSTALGNGSVFAAIDTSSFVMTPSQAAANYQSMTGTNAIFNPAESVQSFIPQNFTDGTLSAQLTASNRTALNNVLGNLYSNTSIDAGTKLTQTKMPTIPFAASSLTSPASSSGMTSYFQNTAPTGSTGAFDASALTDEFTRITNNSMAMGDTFSSDFSFDKLNSMAYENLQQLYAPQTSAASGSSAKSAVASFDYSNYMQSVQGMYSEGYADMAKDYAAACGLSGNITENEGLTAMNNLQNTAISTDQLVTKYNYEQTDGILSLSELKAMYDKAFSSGDIASALMA